MRKTKLFAIIGGILLVLTIVIFSNCEEVPVGDFDIDFENFLYAEPDTKKQNIVIYKTSPEIKKEKIISISGGLSTGIKGKVSPDGKKLALTTYSVLHTYGVQENPSPLLLINLETKEESTITTPRKGEWINSFIWLSNSKSLFYALESFSESKGIWRYDIETKQNNLLLSANEFGVRGLVSFLGKEVHEKVYLSLETEFVLGLWEINRDGLGLRKLYTPEQQSAIFPVLSPDEKKVVYYVYDTGASFANIIQLLDIETQEKRDLIILNESETLLPYAPLWSPDGQQILYGYSDNFWLVNREGNRNKKFIPIHEPPMEPLSWSPTGESIAVAAYQPGLRRGRDLYKIALINYKQKKVHTIVGGDAQFIDWVP